jgi:hypothetical protein
MSIHRFDAQGAGVSTPRPQPALAEARAGEL